MSEETIIDNVASKEKPQNGTVRKSEKHSVESNNRAKSYSSKKKKENSGSSKGIVGASAMAAAAGVAVGLLTPVEVFPQASEMGEDVELDTSSVGSNGEEMEVATSVDDSMSFSEAFAAAREEVGAGGLFVWHGNTYGTYYKEEWDSMTAEEKEEYWADVYQTTSQMNEENNNESSEEVIADVEESIIAEEIPSEPLDGWDGEGELAEAEAVLEEENMSELVDVVESEGEVAYLTETVEESDIFVEDSILDEQGFVEDSMMENPDIDLLASNETDSFLAIENDMDMSEFA
jgi:hypothetical protein